MTLFGENILVALFLELKVRKSQKMIFWILRYSKENSTKKLHREFETVGATCSLEGSFASSIKNLKIPRVPTIILQNSLDGTLVQDKMCQNKNYFKGDVISEHIFNSFIVQFSQELCGRWNKNENAFWDFASFTVVSFDYHTFALIILQSQDIIQIFSPALSRSHPA